jgi:hypothetical protein
VEDLGRSAHVLFVRHGHEIAKLLEAHAPSVAEHGMGDDVVPRERGSRGDDRAEPDRIGIGRARPGRPQERSWPPSKSCPPPKS